MVESNIDKLELSNKLNDAIDKASHLLIRGKQLIPSLVLAAFDKQGYLYTFNPESDKFTITIDENSSIEGQFSEEYFRVSVITKVVSCCIKSTKSVALSLTDSASRDFTITATPGY